MVCHEQISRIAESFINYNYDYDYEEINKIADPYWVAQCPDAMSSSDEEDEEATPAGVVAVGSSSEDSDSDDDVTIGQLYTRS